MNKVLILTISLLISTGSSCVSDKNSNEKENFFKYWCGMSLEDVEKIEGRKPIKCNSSHGIYYELYDIDYLDYKSTAIYRFTKQNRLREIEFWISSYFANDEKYFKTFVKLQKKLIRRYGTPDRTWNRWIKPEYKTDEDGYGKALIENKVSISYEWHETGSLEIDHSISYDNITESISHSVIYDCEEIWKEELNKWTKEQKK